MIADMLSNKKSSSNWIIYPVVTELFIRGRKLNISLVLLENVMLMCQKILG